MIEYEKLQLFINEGLDVPEFIDKRQTRKSKDERLVA